MSISRVLAFFGHDQQIDDQLLEEGRTVGEDALKQVVAQGRFQCRMGGIDLLLRRRRTGRGRIERLGGDAVLFGRSAFVLVELAELRLLHQEGHVDAFRPRRQQRLALVGRHEATPSRRGDQPGLAHVEFRPVDTVVQHTLASARQKLVPLCRCQAEIIGDALRDVGHAGLALGGEAKDGEHEGLVVGDGHRDISRVRSDVQARCRSSGGDDLARRRPQ